MQAHKKITVTVDPKYIEDLEELPNFEPRGHYFDARESKDNEWGRIIFGYNILVFLITKDT